MSTASSRVLRTAKTAIKFQWASHKIDEFVSTLDRLRNSLTLATLLALRKNSETSNAEVLTHLLKIQDDCQYQGLNTTRTQNTIEALSNSIQNRTDDAFQTIQGLNTACLDEIRALRHEKTRSEKGISREVEILEWLDFRQILWRYYAIDKAYKDTYEWIFHPSSEQNRWSDLVAHLQNDSMDPYFVNGKAGSGKSTLMKFLQIHKTTRASLERWAGSKKLAVSHFYFWSLGTSLQKTHTGLLRALLHDILEQYPELIPAVFPKLFRARIRLDEAYTPQYIELKEAFTLMIKKSNFLKIAIFIDGIDEFDGDHQDMAMFLRSLSSADLKLVVSSRPLNACLGALEGCPSLRLQDLTRPDMKRYVDEKLSFHPLMVQSPEQASVLTTELMDKADGVFLWVVITVRLLIKGVEDGDNLDELQQTLRSLPADLKSLYRRMFGKLEPHYRKQGSELFQLMRKWEQHISSQGFSTLTAFHATRSPLMALDTQISDTVNQNYEIVDIMDKRVRSRSCGLLEVLSNPLTSMDSSSVDFDASTVTYMHRTVGEFLALDEVWEEVCSPTTNTDFDPTSNLASACLTVAKVSYTLQQYDTQETYMSFAAKFCRGIVALTPAVAYGYVAELYKLRCTGASIIPRHGRNIHAFAAECGIVQYYFSVPFLSFLALLDQSHQDLYNVAYHALRSWNAEQYTLSLEPLRYEEHAIVLSHILEHVVGPDNVTFGHELWLTALNVCDRLIQEDATEKDCIILLLDTVLRASGRPAVLWQQACEYQELDWFDPKTFLQEYKTNINGNVEEEKIKLFEGLEKLVAPGNSTQPIHGSPEGPGKKQPKPKKRKNKGHQPQSKRRR
jgi:hypothetical protein